MFKLDRITPKTLKQESGHEIGETGAPGQFAWAGGWALYAGHTIGT